ncbi:hypothetical protein EVAR_95626_1 [Eumeta japonica]|uniref:Uncharacterized protein n=1 Tax=Eumeta variegata TaxID=151549 RepID=A0A4C2AAD6_EUMVA|nr:hypothetical protein EVAR_95626_1 [Eumeta japonica]
MAHYLAGIPSLRMSFPRGTRSMLALSRTSLFVVKVQFYNGSNLALNSAFGGDTDQAASSASRSPREGRPSRTFKHRQRRSQDNNNSNLSANESVEERRVFSNTGNPARGGRGGGRRARAGPPRAHAAVNY